MIRPTRMKAAEAPRFVSAEDDDDFDDEEDELALDNDESNASRVKEARKNATTDITENFDTDPELDHLIAEAEQDGDGERERNDDSFSEYEEEPASPVAKRPASKSAARSKGQSLTNKKAVPQKADDEMEPSGRKINPNAHSHMNFRSLKIKNKNSKAKGRGRFGRGRR